jgi:hypothetical protein
MIVKTEIRNKIRKIGALIVIGMFIFLSMSESAIAPPGWNWDNDGNDADSDDYLGTNNNQDLRLYTYGS